MAGKAKGVRYIQEVARRGESEEGVEWGKKVRYVQEVARSFSRRYYVFICFCKYAFLESP